MSGLAVVDLNEHFGCPAIRRDSLDALSAMTKNDTLGPPRHTERRSVDRTDGLRGPPGHGNLLQRLIGNREKRDRTTIW